MYRLRNRLAARINPTLADPRLEPRLNQIMLPLLSVAPGAQLPDLIRSAAHNLQSRLVVDRYGSTEGHVVSVLKRLLGEDADTIVSVAQIAAAFVDEFASEYERPVTNRWIGSVLRRLGIALYKRNGVIVLVPGQHERIAMLCKRYGARSDEPGR